MLKANINERESVERMAGRLKRLRKSLPRAEGDRKTALEAEIAGIRGRLTERKRLIEEAFADPAPEPAAAEAPAPAGG